MINWLVQQQILLTITLSLLIAMTHFSGTRISPLMVYRLWFLLPINLLLNNVPRDFVSLKVDVVARYTVGVSSPSLVADHSMVFVFWSLGSISVVCFFGLQYFKLARLGKRKHPNIARAHFCEHITSPLLFGFISTKILLPLKFTETFNKKQQQLIIEHECTHLRRGDHIWNLLALGLLALFWFNPICWLALNRFRIAQELACDHSVIADKPSSDKQQYAEALLVCIASGLPHRNAPSLANSATFSPMIFPHYGNINRGYKEAKPNVKKDCWFSSTLRWNDKSLLITLPDI